MAFGLWIRLKLEDTPIFKAMEARGDQPKAPIREVLTTQRRPLLAAMLSRIGPDVTYALCTVFTLTYGIQELGFDRGQVLVAVLVGSGLQLFTMPLAGAISDRINRRLVYGIAAVAAAVWAYLFFIVLDGRSPVMLVVGTVLGLLCHSFMYGPQAAFVVEQFTPRLRSTGSSLAYTFAGIIGGAIAPFMFTLLQSTFHSWVPVAIYLSVACLLTRRGPCPRPRLQCGRGRGVPAGVQPNSRRAAPDPDERQSRTHGLVAPAEARRQFRNGLVTPTSGWSDGYTQANLIAVTADYADEFLEFCRLNPKACPVIDVIPAGSYESSLAAGSDIRTDIPAYRVWKDGVLAAEVPDASLALARRHGGRAHRLQLHLRSRAWPARASRCATPKRAATCPCTAPTSSAPRQGGSTAPWSSRCARCRPNWWKPPSG